MLVILSDSEKHLSRERILLYGLVLDRLIRESSC